MFINYELLLNNLKNTIWYYRGAPEITYPKKKYEIVKCEMWDYQYKEYKEYKKSKEQ